MSSRVAPPQLRQIGEPCAEHLKSVAHIQNVLCSILTLSPPVNKDLLGQKGNWVCDFNLHAILSGEREEYTRNLTSDYFEKPQTASAIPESVRETVKHALFPYYVQASIAAKANQTRFHRAGMFIYGLSAAAVGCAAMGVLFPSVAGAGFGAEMVLLIIIWLTLRQARRKHSVLSVRLA